MRVREPSPGSPILPVVLVVVSMASIQVGAACAKRILPTLGPLGAVTLRTLFAALLLLAVLRPWRVRWSRADLASVAVYGAALGGMNVLFYVSLRSIPLGIATALEFIGPLAVAMHAARRASDYLWIALAAIGLLLLLPLTSTSPNVDLTGALFALAAGGCWALYIVYGRRAGNTHGVQTAALGMGVAALTVLPLGVAATGAALLEPASLAWGLAVAVLSSALPYSLEMVALRRLPAQTFGTLMSAEPAFGALAGLVLLGERLAPQQWLAIVAIVVASVGTTLTAAPRSAPST